MCCELRMTSNSAFQLLKIRRADKNAHSFSRGIFPALAKDGFSKLAISKCIYTEANGTSKYYPAASCQNYMQNRYPFYVLREKKTHAARQCPAT